MVICAHLLAVCDRLICDLWSFAGGLWSFTGRLWSMPVLVTTKNSEINRNLVSAFETIVLKILRTIKITHIFACQLRPLLRKSLFSVALCSIKTKNVIIIYYLHIYSYVNISGM